MTTENEGSALTYIVRDEAWYARRLPPEDPQIWVSKASSRGGCFWEFSVVQVSNIGIQVRVFNDSWEALTEIPEFFACLAAMGKEATLDKVRDRLDDLGFVDRTARDDPERYQSKGPDRRAMAERVVGRLDDTTWRMLSSVFGEASES